MQAFFNATDVGTRKRQPRSQFIRRSGDVNEILQPVVDNLHAPTLTGNRQLVSCVELMERLRSFASLRMTALSAEKYSGRRLGWRITAGSQAAGQNKYA